MADRVLRKWRPRLSWIVVAVLLVVAALPVTLVAAFRLRSGTLGIGGLEIGGLALATVLTLLFAALFTRTLTGPIEALIVTTRNIATGGRAAIVAPPRQGTRELAELSQSFLDLAGRLVDRSDCLQTFATHVSHELKSPLAAIRGAAELLRDTEMTEEERAKFLGSIISETNRMALLLDRLRELAKAETASSAGVIRLADLAARLGGSHPGIRIAMSGEDVELPLSTEAADIAFGHLADNAERHGATRLLLSASRERDLLKLWVRDDGSGVSQGNRERIFEPFFTTRREAGGTGMGLGIVRSLLASRGGSIVLAASESGAAFEISLPAAQPR